MCVFDRATCSDSADDSIANIQLASLSYVATIGVGGFGRVELVRRAMNS